MHAAPDPGSWHIGVYGRCAAGFGVFFVDAPGPTWMRLAAAGKAKLPAIRSALPQQVIGRRSPREHRDRRHWVERVSRWAWTPPGCCYQEGRPMFDVELSVDSFGGLAIVALYGELRVADAPGLASHLITAVAACGPSIIVDMAGLAFVDSCGLGVLVRVLKWTRESGGDMALAAPQPQVRQVLSVTGLIDEFSVYPSVELAASGPGLAPPASAAVS